MSKYYYKGNGTAMYSYPYSMKLLMVNNQDVQNGSDFTVTLTNLGAWGFMKWQWNSNPVLYTILYGIAGLVLGFFACVIIAVICTCLYHIVLGLYQHYRGSRVDDEHKDTQLSESLM